MKQVSILVPQGHFSMVNIEGTHQIFSWVNQWLEQRGAAPVFHLQLVGTSPQVTQTNGLFAINPEVMIADVTDTDLIVIPAIHGHIDDIVAQNKEALPWIIQQYNGGAEMACMCIGSFFLAATGLLNGRPCATHCISANDFRRLFPDVLLMDDRIMTEADGIYTSGGAYSFTNLLMYLVEKYAGRDAAIMAAKAFMIDIDRSTSQPFLALAGEAWSGVSKRQPPTRWWSTFSG